MTTDAHTTAPEAGQGAARPPMWFWIVAVLALLWEAMGCFAYVTQMTMSEEARAALPPLQQRIWAAMPGWATAAYAVAVWTGLAGALLLLLRRKWAQWAFLVSLAGVLAQFGWFFLGNDLTRQMPLAESAPFPAVIIVLAAALWWFSGWSGKRGWLG